MKPPVYILAVETSCDETSAAVVQDGHIILSNIIASQIKSHERFGGVVPEVASRHHIEQITLCMDEALKQADIMPSELSAVAVTEGPGLVGALLVGIQAAKAFSWAHQLPLIRVNHMAGHIYSAKCTCPLEFPLMALLVSGGHTELVYMPEDGTYEIIGSTRDDAVGEAYDKIGRILGLPYPSGRLMDEMAHQGIDCYDFPRPLLYEDHYDFSFSGLKSSVMNFVNHQQQKNIPLELNHIAASFQASVIDVLVTKTMKACQDYQVNTLVVAGGVAANKGLKTALEEYIKHHDLKINLMMPSLQLCGDNAAMIGAAAYIDYQRRKFSDLSFNATPGLELDDD